MTDLKFSRLIDEPAICDYEPIFLGEVIAEKERCEKQIPMSVIEDIKAEIEAKAKERKIYLDAGHPYEGLYEALEIIDKHISEK